MKQENIFIRLKKETRDKLESLKIIERDTYDNVINRLINKK